MGNELLAMYSIIRMSCSDRKLHDKKYFSELGDNTGVKRGLS